jgi:hypothetical protein
MQQRERAEARALAVEHAPRGPTEAVVHEAVRNAVEAVQRQADAHIEKANEDRDTAIGLMVEQATRNDELDWRVESLDQELRERDIALKKARTNAEMFEIRLSEVENTAQERQAIQRIMNPNVPRGMAAEKFLGLLLPRLNLDSVGVNELLDFDAPRDVVEVLLELDKGETPRFKKFEGIPDGVSVKEVDKRLSIGSGAKGGMGRVYYHDPGDDRFTVFVQRKKDETSQNRAVRAFADRCRRVRNTAKRS